MYFRSLSLNHRSCVRFPESILHLSFAVHSSHQLCSPVAVWVKSMSSFCFACENQKTSRSKPSHTASRIQSSTQRITSETSSISSTFNISIKFRKLHVIQSSTSSSSTSTARSLSFTDTEGAEVEGSGRFGWTGLFRGLPFHASSAVMTLMCFLHLESGARTMLIVLLYISILP